MEALDIEQLAKRDAAKNAQSAAEDAAKIKKRGYDDVVISDVSSTDTVPNGKTDEENNKKARKADQKYKLNYDIQFEQWHTTKVHDVMKAKGHCFITKRCRRLVLLPQPTRLQSEANL
uniref:Uncharacterized protein n=1 Tax=Parascaris univalens TaxID=6257 RepID=A0A915A114_PARUN